MEFKDHHAIYLQIADYVCKQVLLKSWKAEERIPSIRDSPGYPGETEYFSPIIFFRSALYNIHSIVMGNLILYFINVQTPL